MSVETKKDLFKDFSSSVQVTDLQYETFLEQKDRLQYFTPIEKAESAVVNVHVVRPKARRVGVVRPVQYPERKICHPVPAALQPPRTSSPTVSAGSTCLPLKKRPYVPTQEDVEPPSKIVKVGGGIEHHETSAFYRYLPDHVINEYLVRLRPKEEKMTDEDTEVADIMQEASSESRIFPFTREFRIREVMPEDIVKKEMNAGYCPSPREPWIPDVASDTIARTERRADEMRSAFQQISPVIISLSPENEGSSPATSADRVRNLSENHKFERNDIGTNRQVVDETQTETGKAAVPEESYTEPYDDAPTAEDKRCRRSQRSIELRHFFLTKDRSADHPRKDRGSVTEKEEFTEILEDFVEENEAPAPHLKDQVLELLFNIRTSAAKERETMWFMAEPYTREADDGATSVKEFEETQSPAYLPIIDSHLPRELFQPIKSIQVETDSTGQPLYDEIAAFFGYDDYTNELLADDEDTCRS